MLTMIRAIWLYSYHAVKLINSSFVGFYRKSNIQQTELPELWYSSYHFKKELCVVSMDYCEEKEIEFGKGIKYI